MRSKSLGSPHGSGPAQRGCRCVSRSAGDTAGHRRLVTSDQRSHAGQSWAAGSQSWDFAGTELYTDSLGYPDLQRGLAKSTDLLQIGDLSNRWVYLNTGHEIQFAPS